MRAGIEATGPSGTTPPGTCMTSTNDIGNLRVQILDDATAIDSLCEALSQLDRRYPPETVYQSAEFLIPWLAFAARRAKLHMIVLWEDRQVRAVLPMASDEVVRGPLRVRRLGFPTLGGHPPTLDVRSGEKDALYAAEVLLSAFTERGAPWKVISLRHLSGSSVLLQLLPELCKRKGLDYTCHPARRESYLMLEGDWDSYLSRLKRHHRKEVNRGFRRIQETPGWEFVDMWPDEDGVPEVLERYLAVIRGSWKSDEADQDGFREFLEALMRSFARRGDLLVSWLSGPDGDGAGLIQLRRGRLLSAFHQAYTSGCPVKGPGTELLGHAISSAYDEGMMIYDFSTSAGHIHRWNPLYRNTFHLYVTKRSPAGWLIQRKLAKRRPAADHSREDNR